MTDQLSLFDLPAPAAPRAAGPLPAAAPDDLRALGERLPPGVRLGTSSWAFPGWAGLVYDRRHPEASLARDGLAAYSSHPVLRAVGIDRTFYAPIGASDFAAYAAQVPAGFRFLVKGPSVVTDAVLRDERGRATAANPRFLDAGWTIDHFVGPAVEGLGEKAGPLVFQMSPMPRELLRRPEEMARRLGDFVAALRVHTPSALLAVEVRNSELVGGPLAEALNDAGARYCFGVHARMPTVPEQAARMAALAPGPLVARWNLHAGYAYEEAKAHYAPFDRLVEPDVDTRTALATLAARAIGAGEGVFVIANNKAEGCAPLTIVALARAIAERTGGTIHGNAC
jgi:uncharacterized protein YecE (DUF72 family)